MTNNDEVLTVGDLKKMLEKVPDNTVVWVFDAGGTAFTPAVNASHDKRVNGFNIWVES